MVIGRGCLQNKLDAALLSRSESNSATAPQRVATETRALAHKGNHALFRRCIGTR